MKHSHFISTSLLFIEQLSLFHLSDFINVSFSLIYLYLKKIIIIHQNKGFPERPALKVITDKNGKEPEKFVIKDLLEYKHVFIEKVIN